jgi:hypothetical protein
VCAGRDGQPQHQVEGLLGAAGDEDLLGRGGHTPFRVRGGHRLPQVDQAGRVVTGAAQVARQVVGGGAGGRDQFDGRRRGGHPHVDHVEVVVRGPQAGRGDPVPGGQRGPAAGAAAAGQVPAFAQRAVRRRDGGAADAERLGQLAFGGQAHAQRQAAVGEQPAHRPGQGGVVGTAAPAGQRMPLTEQAGQLASTHRRRHSHLRGIGSLEREDWPSEWHV